MLGLALVYLAFQMTDVERHSPANNVSYSEFVQNVKDDKVKEVTIQGNEYYVAPKDSNVSSYKIISAGNDAQFFANASFSFPVYFEEKSTTGILTSSDLTVPNTFPTFSPEAFINLVPVFNLPAKTSTPNIAGLFCLKT